MKRRALVFRGLTHYWRTNVAVVLGVATAVAVLCGALLVGDSVRGSLRDLVVQRLGRADRIVVGSSFFREALADDIRRDDEASSAVGDVCPLVVMQGVVTDQQTGRRAARVQVYGVDDRFWRFHALNATRGPEARDALINRTLASEIGAAAGGAVLVRIERPSAIPIESLHGRKDNVGRTLRLTVRGVVGPEEGGDFSLQPQQGAVRTVFVPLKRLQQDLEVTGRVNALLVANRERRGAAGAGPNASDSTRGVSATGSAAPLDAIIRRRFALEDVGLTVRVASSSSGSTMTRATASAGGSRGPAERSARRTPAASSSATSRDVSSASLRSLVVEAPAGLIDEPRARAIDEAAKSANLATQPVLTYLANAMRSGDRQVPYSLVTATDLAAVAPTLSAGAVAADARPPIVINDWTARDLGVRVGDPLTLEYYVWVEPGQLLTRTSDFRVTAIVPIAGLAADRDLAPVYPGITEAATLKDWDPPFPIDLHRVRPVDEDYWNRYRTTPKAFIPLEVGQRLWRSRFGDRTSVRLPLPGSGDETTVRDFTARLRSRIDPLAMGLAARDVRQEGLAASRGATDFGEYFTYFSFFLVVSALMLAALFFRLGVEQRAREIGLLRAVGFTNAAVRRLFSAEGLVLAAVGSVLGVAGGIAYAAIMVTGLRTWWSGAVGTTALALHVSPSSLAIGAAGALAVAMACIWWTLRTLARVSERSLLGGAQQAFADHAQRPATRSGATAAFRPVIAAVVFAAFAFALIAASARGVVDPAAAFFGAGSALLVASLFAVAARLKGAWRSPAVQTGPRAVWRLGIRNASDRPGRTVLAIGVIASATFMLISVGAFRRDTLPAADRQSGVGGYPLLVDLLLPVADDPNGRDGRAAIGIPTGDQVHVDPFRVRPGDDASCLNLYEPRNPRVLGVSQGFITSGRFAFQSSIAADAAERANPWVLLNRRFDGDVVPVIADANSMTYVLHKSLGDDIVIAQGGRPIRLRLVAALADSVFQGELLMADTQFVRLFPEQQGYRFLLVDAPADRAAALANAIEETASDLGADAVPTTERLAQFHTVENTYLSTFQMLGGLGLVIGTIGLASVVLRNVLERRRELALLAAVGYRRDHIFTIVVSENLFVLICGLAIGALCASIAIAPAVSQHGGRLPATRWDAVLLIAVFGAGLLSSIVATRAALHTQLLNALRSE